MKKEHILIVCVVLVISLCIVFDIALAGRFAVNEKPDDTEIETTVTEKEPETETDPPETTAPPVVETEPEEYRSPIDFEALYAENEHIYSVIKIENTNINFPIVQHPTDKTFYLRRGLDKKYDVYGSVFTEHVYNTTDFTDPVTMIYGHDTRNGRMFGDLHTMYYNELTTHGEIVVYLPEKELHYQVFAAVVHDKRHVLYYNDFSNPDVFNSFFGKVFEKEGEKMVVDKECELSPDDKVIILSTCVENRPDNRFLVMAKLVEVVE